MKTSEYNIERMLLSTDNHLKRTVQNGSRAIVALYVLFVVGVVYLILFN